MNMIDEDIKQRIRYARAKLRNIPYYWDYDESLGECRSRKQYMHILRSFRKQLESLLLDIGKEDNSYDVSVFKNIIKIISPKIKKEDCSEVINKMKAYVY